MADLEIPDNVKEALANVRDDTNKCNFATVSFDSESKAHKLKLLGQGENGVEGLIASFDQSEACYALLRVDFTFEKAGNITSSGTRFIFIFLRPENLPLKRKMMLGSVEGKVKKLFSPYMKSLEIDSVEKLSAEGIQSMIDSITMTKNRTTTKKAKEGIFIAGRFVPAKSEKTEKAKQFRGDTSFRFNVSKGALVSFEDEDKVKEIVDNVRSDENELTYCIFSYKDKSTISLESTGTDENSVDALMEALPGDKISYALFRVVENYSSGRNTKGEKTAKIDTARFGFIVFVPDEGKLSPVVKALVSTHKGEVVKRFRPFMHQWFLTARSELNAKKALLTFQKISGTKSNVTDRKVSKTEKKFVRKLMGGNTGKTQELAFEDKEALLEAIADVRKDSSEVVFALAAFTGTKRDLKIKLESSGTSLDKLVESLRDDAIMYAFIRRNAVKDGYDTARFELIKYDGPSVSISYKGSAGVYHGAITNAFGQTHAYYACTSRDDLRTKLSL